MLNYRNVNILFASLVLLSIAAHIRYGISFYTYVILFVAYSLLLFYGCYYVGSNFFIPIVCSAKTDEKIIALSFDDGPDATHTPAVLQLLKDNGVEAAFFCIGSKVAENKAILKQANDEGHVIGNHSFSHHFWFDMFPAKKMLEDMDMTDLAVKDVIGKTPKLFRPPYGVTNPNLKKAIVSGAYTPVGWSVRTMDTVIKDEQKLLNKAIAKIKPGAVFLFHDTCQTTLAILPAFIKHVTDKGYKIVRMDKMLNLQAYA